MKKYTTLLFDADNTLLDFTMAENRAIEATCNAYKIPFSSSVAGLYSNINDTFWKRFEKGEITRDVVKIGRFERFLSAVGSDAPPKEVALYYMEQLANGGFLINGAADMLKTLCSLYDMYIITNGTSWIQKKRLALSGINKYFSGCFISEDMGCQKPEKAYFDYVLAHIPEKDKNKICIIGDSMSSDILGGINSGINTCYFSPGGKSGTYIPTYTAKNFDQILTLFKDLK